MPNITPFLWFDNEAEAAMNFYVSIFPNSKVLSVNRNPEGAPMPAGTVQMATFELNGQTVMILNGGPFFKQTEAFSFFVNCETQDEVDFYWAKLTEGGSEGQCGWLKDKFGVSWQIVPSALGQVLGNPDPAKAQRAMEAMLKMSKLDIRALESAAELA